MAPSVINKQIPQKNLGWKPMFLGDGPCCDAGGCQKAVLTESQALVVPDGIIHVVETQSK